MDMVICRICGSEYNRQATPACPFPDRHAFRRAYNHETGVTSHKYFGVTPDGDEVLREQHHFLEDCLLVQWYEGERVVHEHLEDYEELFRAEEMDNGPSLPSRDDVEAKIAFEREHGA